MNEEIGEDLGSTTKRKELKKLKSSVIENEKRELQLDMNDGNEE
jgi:hypothetical protein